METILIFILIIFMILASVILAILVLRKDTKEFHIQLNSNGFDLSGSFYEHHENE